MANSLNASSTPSPVLAEVSKIFSAPRAELRFSASFIGTCRVACKSTLLPMMMKGIGEPCDWAGKVCKEQDHRRGGAKGN